MNTAAAPHIAHLDSYQTALGILRAPFANVLVEGPFAFIDDVLLVLQPHLREPLVSDLAHAPLRLPDGAARPMILRNVVALTGRDQGRLLAWLQAEGFGALVVSTTERPLFALVVQGLFDEALYYRLNVLLLRIGATNAPGFNENGLPNDPTAIAEDALGASEDQT